MGRAVSGVAKRSLSLLIGLLVVWPQATLAAPASRNTSGGITLSPFLQQIAIAPSDLDKSFSLNLTNHTTGVQELDLKAEDFGSLNDTGGILLEGSKASYSQKYGLTSWLTLEADTVVLQPGESRSVLVTVNNRPDLQPGGHYGAIAANVNSLVDQSGNRVVINQQLLSLVFVDKVGGEHYDLKLDSISPNGNLLSLPNTVKLRFQNPGNIHVIPRGLVKLKSPSGTVVAQGVINSESAFILPESFREIYVPLKPLGQAVPWPGLYHVEVDYRYDQIAKYAAKQTSVQFIDLGLYLLIAGLLVVLFKVRHKLLKKPHKKSQKTE